jgi:hypothetical protein
MHVPDLGGGKLKNLGAGAQKCPRVRLAKMSQGQTQEQPLGGQPPKGQSALLKQEESGLICFTSFLFSSQVNSHRKITSTSSNIKISIKYTADTYWIACGK